MRRRGRWSGPGGLAGAAAAASLFLGAPAGASDSKEKDQCIAAADQGQQFRDEGKYLLAHDSFARCASDTCPSLVRQDCAQWLRDLDEKIPTVVLDAQDQKGNDLSDVSATLDGSSFVATFDAKPAPVDPGDHVLHVEAQGFAPVDTHVLVRAGEKNRVIVVQFKSRLPARVASSAAAPRGPPAPAAPPPAHASAYEMPLAGWVLGGVALAAFATDAYFGISGLTERSSDLAAGGCAPHCSASEKGAVQSKFLLADVSLGVGLVSAGLAAYFFFSSGSSRGRESGSLPAVDVSPRPGGGVASVAAHF